MNSPTEDRIEKLKHDFDFHYTIDFYYLYLGLNYFFPIQMCHFHKHLQDVHTLFTYHVLRQIICFNDIYCIHYPPFLN